MSYTKEEVAEFIKTEDVKFIRLAFCDVFGRQKNAAIVPDELERAFTRGVAFQGQQIAGFKGEGSDELFLQPIPSTLTVLPWRSVAGKVVRMFCDVNKADGTPYELDSRRVLQSAEEESRAANLVVSAGCKCEFYLFKTDEAGEATQIPFDSAGYMDIAPQDKGENIRREICLNLAEMGLHPECSHHEKGPGQNQIDFRRSEPLECADNTLNFFSVVRSVAMQNGLVSDFSPKPLLGGYGNGFHMSFAIEGAANPQDTESFAAGILCHAREMTAFLNPALSSYARLGNLNAPKYVTWGRRNFSQLLRLKEEPDGTCVIVVRSPDSLANPYIAYALLIRAGLDGIKQRMTLPPPIEEDLSKSPADFTSHLDVLPKSLREAQNLAQSSPFIQQSLPAPFIDALAL